MGVRAELIAAGPEVRNKRVAPHDLRDFGMSELKPAPQRVQDAANRLGLAVRVVEMTQSTRTAEEAAAACGCNVAQIIKSLVFRGKKSGNPVLLLVSGANRVDQKGVASAIGEVLDRPDATYVREVTGFAIGGIPPFGHAQALPTWIDEDLLQYPTVWAAAGSPEAVFEVDPRKLAETIEAVVIGVKGGGSA
jgi:prolyl-tRNA editing enzyme YbaK/EbsC (Cys-tRNA(Pro) deacylase)